VHPSTNVPASVLAPFLEQRKLPHLGRSGNLGVEEPFAGPEYLDAIEALLVTFIVAFVLPTILWVAVIDTMRLWASRRR
jgi:hypothetical protein